ncbi:MAG: mandelate racemase/muconate lactonizing enzyme family protein [Trueperaceae bacterium]
MKITEIRPIIVGNPWKNWIFVVVETDEGITGYGEATVGLNSLPVEAAIREIAHLCLGKDPRNIHALWDLLYKAMNLTEGQVQKAAMAGIEIACWDILGKSLNTPVYQLLGGRMRTEIRAYANGWYRGERDPAAFAEMAAEVVSRGYTALKFDPFGASFQTISAREEKLSIDIVRAVKEAVGEGVDIIIEAHDRFTVQSAIRIGHQLAEFSPLWYEAPVLSTDIEDLVAVARAVPVPVGVGERFTSQREFTRLLAHNVIDIINPETIDIGGLWPTREVAAIANANNAVVAIHNARGPICSAANCHLDLTLPNLLIQETFQDFNDPWTRDVVVGTPELQDGYLRVSDRPGLGIELNEDVAKEHPYSPGNFMRLFESGWETRFGSNKAPAA